MMAGAVVVTHLAERVAERSRNTAKDALRRELRTARVRQQDRCSQNPANNDCAPTHGRTPSPLPQFEQW
jgi:hypothetical protein